MRFQISAEIAWRIRPFCATDEARYYLHGFCVEPLYIDGVEKGASVVATNGHMLGLFYDPHGRCEIPGVCKLNRYTLAACKPNPGIPDRILYVDHARAEVRMPGDLGQPDDTIAGQSITPLEIGQFPDWRHVMPKELPTTFTVPGCFNHQYITAIAKAAGTKSIRIASTDAASPAFVITENPNFVGLLMPMRGEDALQPWFSACVTR